MEFPCGVYMEKEKIKDILKRGKIEEIIALQLCYDSEICYGQYEIEGYSHPKKCDDGKYHSFDACYSLNDGKISDRMRKAIDDYREYINDTENIWVYTNDNGKEQAFVIYYNGTNGKKGNVLNSMRDSSEKLENIQGFTEWATLLDCHCDTLDDVYGWLFTFEV